MSAPPEIDPSLEIDPLDLLPADLGGFIQLHQKELTQFAWRRTGSFHDAEELVADVFVKLHATWDVALSHPNPLALAYRILRHAIIDRRRRTKHEVITDFTDPAQHRAVSPAVDPSDGVVATAALHHEIAAMPERQAECALLYFVLRLDYAEVADRLGITASTARSHVHAARRDLTAVFRHPHADPLTPTGQDAA